MGVFYLVLKDTKEKELRTSSFPTLPTIADINNEIDNFVPVQIGKVIISFKKPEQVASFEWSGTTLPEAREIRKKFLALREISD